MKIAEIAERGMDFRKKFWKKWFLDLSLISKMDHSDKKEMDEKSIEQNAIKRSDSKGQP